MIGSTEQLIDLPRAPRILYIIGLAGAGKSYVGNLIGRRAGYYVYHADDDLPLELRQAVARCEPWTEEQRDNFYSLVSARVLELSRLYPRVVVTQATYKQQHRDAVYAVIPDIEFLWVVAEHSINVHRIKTRDDFVSVEYFEKTKHYFEIPPREVKQIVNNGTDADIINQLIAYYG